jgi:hypothetical protein
VPHRVLVAGIFILAAVLIPPPTEAASQDIELVLSLYRLKPCLDTSYTHTYTPRLEYGTSSGTALQVLGLKAEPRSALGAGLIIRPVRNIGVQLLVDSFSTALEGPGGPYILTLEYRSRQPPQYDLQTYTYERTSPRSPAEGTLKETAVSLGVLVRLRAAGGPAVDLSAGPTLFFVSAEAQSPTFTAFWLGGHSVLFSEDYDLEIHIPSSTRLGFHAGFEIVLFTGRNFGGGGGIRYYLCPDYDVAGELALLKKPGSHIREIDLTAQNIPVSALRMNPSFLKLGFTIRFRL